MVWASASAVEGLQALVAAVRGADHNPLKLAGTELAGAGTGDEEPFRCDQLEGELVEVCVFCDACFVFAAMNEFWRVGDDEVPCAAVFNHGACPGEGVGVGEFHLRRVQVRIAFCHGDGGLVQVNCGHLACPCESCGDTEAAGVAAEIQDAAAGREGSKFFPVVALIAEKPGFVAAGKIDFVADPVFANFYRAHRIRFHAAEARDAFDAGEFLIHADDDAACVEGFVEERKPLREALPCGEVGDFHREDVGELVCDDPGHEVRVAMDGAVTVGFRVEFEHFPAELGGAADGICEESLVLKGGERVADDAQGHPGFRVPESPAEGGALLAKHEHERAGAGVARDLSDHFWPDRGVEGLVFKLDSRHGGNTPQKGGIVDGEDGILLNQAARSALLPR